MKVAPVVVAHARESPGKIAAEVGAYLGIGGERLRRPPPTVMVVDDDDLEREALAAFLDELGCAVCVAASAEEALAVAARQPIDLLITDQHMPGASGTDLAAHVGALQPGVRIAIVTGSADEVVEQLLDTATIDLVLAKPIAGADLVNWLSEMSSRSAR